MFETISWPKWGLQNISNMKVGISSHKKVTSIE